MRPSDPPMAAFACLVGHPRARPAGPPPSISNERGGAAEPSSGQGGRPGHDFQVVSRCRPSSGELGGSHLACRGGQKGSRAVAVRCASSTGGLVGRLHRDARGSTRHQVRRASGVQNRQNRQNRQKRRPDRGETEAGQGDLPAQLVGRARRLVEPDDEAFEAGGRPDPGPWRVWRVSKACAVFVRATADSHLESLHVGHEQLCVPRPNPATESVVLRGGWPSRHAPIAEPMPPSGRKRLYCRSTSPQARGVPARTACSMGVPWFALSLASMRTRGCVQTGHDLFSFLKLYSRDALLAADRAPGSTRQTA